MGLGLITVSEAAVRKGVSRWAIYKAIADGRLRSQKELGKVALREKDVDKWQPAPSRGRRSGSRLSEETKGKISRSLLQRKAKKEN
jgi:excisionase family DNA binding protein